MRKNEEPDQNDNPPKRRSARLSRNQIFITKEETLSQPRKPAELPFIDYRGAIMYYTDEKDIAATSEKLIQWVAQQTALDIVPMAFDMEWPFSFQTGPGRTSVIQICLEENCCYIFQLSKLNKLPDPLLSLLKHPKIKLHGVCIKNDIRKLKRDFPEVNAEELIDKSIDLGLWCNQVYETSGRWSLERLTKFIAKKRIDKSKKVRMSKWHVMPLDENQLMYAAIDVYIGQVIYEALEQRMKEKQMKQTEFKEKHGDLALKQIKVLGENFIS